MSCAVTAEFTVIRGTNHKYRITFTDENGDPVDLTGATVEYRWKRNPEDDDPPEILKSSAVGPTEVEILVPETGGLADAFITESDTELLLSGIHYHEAKGTLSDGTIHKRAPAAIELVEDL